MESGNPWTGSVRVTAVYGDTDVGGRGLAEAIHGEWQSMDGVRVTPVYGDTLTLRRGDIAVAIHGL